MRVVDVRVLGLAVLLGSAACTDGEPENTSGAEAPIHQEWASLSELRTVTLESGLVVDVRGAAEELAQLGERPTSEELCEGFRLSVTALFSPDGELQRYAASATSRHAPTFEPGQRDFEGPIAHVENYLDPMFPEFSVPAETLFAHMITPHVGVVPFRLTATAAPLPNVVSIYDSQNSAPIAVFGYGIGQFEVYPSTWADASTAGAYAGERAWARIFDGALVPEFADMTTTLLSHAFVQDLVACGDIIAVPFGLPAEEDGGGTVPPNQAAAVGITLSPTRQEFWAVDYPCPRPEELEDSYVCASSPGEPTAGEE